MDWTASRLPVGRHSVAARRGVPIEWASRAEQSTLQLETVPAGRQREFVQQLPLVRRHDRDALRLAGVEHTVARGYATSRED